MLLVEPADPVPRRGEHLQDHFFGFVRIAQHRPGEAEEPRAGELDELHQRLLVALDEAAAERCFARHGEPIRDRRGAWRRTGLNGMGRHVATHAS